MRPFLGWLRRPEIPLGAVYVLLALPYLGSVPAFDHDEAWTASASYSLVSHGRLATHILTGFAGFGELSFVPPPLYELVLAPILWIFGLGIWPIRLLGLSLGLTCFLLTGALARRVAGDRAAVVASLLAVAVPFAPSADGLGPPLVDYARFGRNDILVPALAASATLALWRALEWEELARGWLLGAGALLGAASLAHLYGAFFLPAFFLSWLLDRPRRASPAVGLLFIAFGFALVLGPWLALAFHNGPVFSAQMSILSDRLEFTDPGFYLRNLLAEPERYSGALLRPGPGSLLFALTIPLGIVTHLRRTSRSPTGRSIALVTLSFGLSLAFLVQRKMPNYVVAYWPFVCVLAGSTLEPIWSSLRGSRVARVAFALCVAAALLELGLRCARRLEAGASATSYSDFSRELEAHLPAGPIVGPARCWVGLPAHADEYRSWQVLFFWAQPRFTERPLDFREGLERLHPKAIIIDQYLRRYLDRTRPAGAERHQDFEGYQRYLTEHGARSVSRFEDPTYGPIEVITFAR